MTLFLDNNMGNDIISEIEQEIIEKSFLQYIGNKRKLISHLIKYMDRKIIVDLMAGTHTLGYALKSIKTVISNDIMEYSFLIGKAIVESSISSLDPIEISYSKDYNFFERNYSGTYFTEKQCRDFDALKFSIEQLDDDLLKACYYSCVFNIMDRIGTTAGHFDGFLKQDTKKAKTRKNKQVIEAFLQEVSRFRNKQNKFHSKVYNLDAFDLLDNINRVDTIYIDPPYNHRQYNTLYHILEMFAKYSGELKDCMYRYPKSRFFSSFCYKSKAVEAFNELIKKCAKNTDNIIFSYSNKGIVPIQTLLFIFEKYFKEIKIEEIDYFHRKQKTSKGKGNVKEYIFSLNK